MDKDLDLKLIDGKYQAVPKEPQGESEKKSVPQEATPEDHFMYGFCKTIEFLDRIAHVGLKVVKVINARKG